MTTPDYLLGLEGVGLRLHGRQILNNIDLQVAPREVVTLIGPNGAGKTSLLRVALGLIPATSGRIRRQPDLRVGYMPQKLHPDHTFPIDVRRFLRLTEPCRWPNIPSVLDEVGAKALLHSPLAALSGGELQRVLLARALLRDPQLLVLDEPVQGVDVHGQAELFRLITDLRQRRGCSVLMVSHDLHLVMASTDRVVCLNGHICCTGSPEAVSRDQRFLDLFGPAVLPYLAFYSHDENHQHSLCLGPHCDCPKIDGGDHV